MFVANEDLSLSATRGDIVHFNVSAEDHGNPYTFKPGDIVRMSIYAKKDASRCVMQKDFPVTDATETVFVFLDEKDTKIGETISKPVVYWYEIVVNPDTMPQTIIGYDDDGPKTFTLLPESEEIGEDEQVEPEEIPVVDPELSMTSHRPVENQAVAIAIVQLKAAIEELKGASLGGTSGESAEGSVFNAIGQIEKLSVLCIDAYGVAVKNGFKGTVEEWLESLRGEPGVHFGSDTPPDDAKVWVDPNGEPTSTEDWAFTLIGGSTETKRVVVVGAEEENGHSGILRVRDENGNWTEIPALTGPRGIQGPQGIQGIQGERGLQGERGIQGIQGERGLSGVHLGSDNPPDDATVWVNPNGEPTSTEDWEFDMEDGSTDTKRVVVVGSGEANGYAGILKVKQEDGTWIEIPAIVGRKGDKGIQGPQGIQGPGGGHYTPSVTQPNADTLEFQFTPSKADMPAVEPVQVELPHSGGNAENGEDGFSPIATVTQTASGAVISITDKDGTTTATITNGKDGKAGAEGAPGEKGDPGKDGTNGVTPHVGSNGNWFIGNTDTGIPATGPAGGQGLPGTPGEDGKDGTSATHSWNGTVLTVTSASGTSSADLKGAKGDKGDPGEQGIQGVPGEKGDPGEPGKDGANGKDGSDGEDGQPGKDGADGQRGTGILNTTTGIASYTTAVGGVSPKYRILLSTLKTQAKVNEVLVGDTVRYSTFLYPIIYVDADYAYMTTRVTIQGTAGSSVTVSSVTESTEDGGSNVVTFSDGKTLTVKNGKTGAAGKDGSDGYTPVRGVDYWTPADIAAIDADIATELAKRGQLKPEFAQTIEECTDTTKLYVLPDGMIYAYMLTEKEVPGGPAYTNLLPTATDTDGTIYNGKGYKPGKTVGSDGTIKETNTVVSATGFISAKNNSVVRIDNINPIFGLGTNIVAYDANKAFIKSQWVPQDGNPPFYGSVGDTLNWLTVEDKGDSYLLTVTLKNAYFGDNVEFIRFAAIMDDTTIVTVDQEIKDNEPTTIMEYDWANTGLAFVPADYEDRIIELEKTVTDLENALDNVAVTANPDLSKNTCSIFRKVVCCGDSFTSGHINIGNGVTETNEDYAWPSFLARLTGNEYINCGSSGATVLSWITAERGLPKAKTEGVAQAYIVGLGYNDHSMVTLGTTADIGTENQTYYAGMSRIVRELNAISPKAKIFLLTIPITYYEPTNQAVRNIVDAYKDIYPVHLLDLYPYKALYSVPSIADDGIGGHYTAIGYQQWAENMRVIWSNYINSHISDFQDVYQIPYD